MPIVYRFIGLGAVAWLIFVVAAVIGDVVTNWGHTVARALALGFLAGCVLYQVAHRIRHGVWYD